MIGRDEFRQPRHAIERFHLSKLRHHDGRAGGFELARPVAEVQIAPLLVNRVGLPGHRTETRVLPGEGGSQSRLDLARLLIPHEILLTHEDDRFLVAEREFHARKCGERRARLAVTETFEHLALGRHGRAGQLLDRDVAKGDFRFAVAVDLKGDQALGGDAGGSFHPRSRALTVERELNLRPTRHDLVVVPVTGLFHPRHQICVGHRQRAIATRFVVQAAGVACADVRLETGHLVRGICDALTAELHAPVHEALRADELVVQAQAEVLIARARGQEFIARIAVERTSDNHALADAPDGLRLALPAGQRLAVEQSRGAREGGAQAQKQQQWSQSARIHGGTEVSANSEV